MNKIASIYKATNKITKKSYIGFTLDFLSRKRIHKNSALNNDSKNTIFYNSIKKYGFDNFEWTILYQSKDIEHTFHIMEDYFINEYKTLIPYGYNMKSGGKGNIFVSEEVRNKISNSRKGIKFSKSHKENLSKALIGKKLTESHKQKIGLASKKQKGSKRNSLSDEIKLKISKSLTGKKKIYSKRLRCSCVICHKEISNNHLGIHYKTHKIQECY